MSDLPEPARSCAASRAAVALFGCFMLVACLETPVFDREAMCQRSVLDCAPYELEGKPGRLRSQLLAEASGLAVTRTSDERLWLINDSGGKAALYQVDGRGKYLGSVAVSGAVNVDWEELATFNHEGKPHILIADVGDNAAVRRSVTLYVVEEPRYEGGRPPKNAKVDVAWSQTFVYEDGPRDCESVAVDPDSGKVLLISKRTEPPSLYELPLGPEHAGQRLVAKKVTDVRGLPMPMNKEKLPNNRQGRFAFQNTALDIAADGRKAAVLTYGATWLFRRRFDESWAAAFSRDPELVATPYMFQAEALAFAPDARLLYVTSEGIPAPFLRLRLREAIPIPE